MAPYGVDKDLGGDSPSNDKYMEMCVKNQMAKGKGKSMSIALCKVILKKHLEKKGKTE